MKKVPHTFVIVFFIIVIAAVMTWFVKPGFYIKENVLENGTEKTELNFYYKASCLNNTKTNIIQNHRLGRYSLHYSKDLKNKVPS